MLYIGIYGLSHTCKLFYDLQNPNSFCSVSLEADGRFFGMPIIFCPLSTPVFLLDSSILVPNNHLKHLQKIVNDSESAFFGIRSGIVSVGHVIDLFLAGPSV